MKNQHQKQSFSLDTEQFAILNKVSAQGIRKRYCETKSYFGVVPKKLANGRLAWPDVQVEFGGSTI